MTERPIIQRVKETENQLINFFLSLPSRVESDVELSPYLCHSPSRVMWKPAEIHRILFVCRQPRSAWNGQQQLFSALKQPRFSQTGC